MEFDVDTRFAWRGFVWQVSAVSWVGGTDWITFFKVGNPGFTNTVDIWVLKKEARRVWDPNAEDETDAPFVTNFRPNIF